MSIKNRKKIKKTIPFTTALKIPRNNFNQGGKMPLFLKL